MFAETVRASRPRCQAKVCRRGRKTSLRVSVTGAMGATEAGDAAMALAAHRGYNPDTELFKGQFRFGDEQAPVYYFEYKQEAW
jgi:hypothetical protein